MSHLKFILMSGILPSCIVYNMQPEIIPTLKWIKTFTVLMLHILVITSSYFHYSQFLQPVVYSFKWQMGKKSVFLSLWFGFGVAGCRWVVLSVSLETKLFQFMLSDFLLIKLAPMSCHIKDWETEDINCNILKLSQYCTHLYVSTNIFLKISPSLQNRLNSFQDHIPC